MLKKFPFAALLCAVALASGCTTHLSEGQKRELDAYEQKGLKAEEKAWALRLCSVSSQWLAISTQATRCWR